MMRWWVVAMVAVGIVAVPAACDRAPSVDRVHGADPPESVWCTDDQTRPRVDGRVWPEDRMIARDLGISAGEFQRQQALTDEAGRLAVELNKDERGTFADLEIDHGRDFRVVAYFTRGGKETVRRHVRCTPLEGRVEVVRVGATIAELEAALDKASRISEEAWGERFTTDVDISKNRAEIIVPNEVRYEAALREADAELPEHVVVVEGGLPVPE